MHFLMFYYNLWNIKKIVGNDRFLLVTSVYHMPRSMALLEKHKMHPIPASTDYLVKQRQGIRPDFSPLTIWNKSRQI